jgi:hypothetical protein
MVHYRLARFEHTISGGTGLNWKFLILKTITAKKAPSLFSIGDSGNPLNSFVSQRIVIRAKK